MTLKITFYGSVDEVTGSRHLIDTGSKKILLDCGLFQGHRKEAIEKNRHFPFNPQEIDDVLLSHAHVDHSGALPLLVKSGFSGAIHCTAQTAELCRIMLMDSAHIHMEDAKFFNKIHAEEGETIEPLYTQEEVEPALRLFKGYEYNEFFSLGDGLKARFLNAGHVLGSAMVEVEADTPKGKRRLLFSGDLGRRDALIMQPPEAPPNINYLIIETTYGSRSHHPTAKIEKELAEIIHKAAAENGKILIPSFALERTQEVVFVVEKLMREKKIPPTHIYVDSPMAAKITDIFNRHLDSIFWSPKFKRTVKKTGDPFGLGTVRYVRDVEESKRLNTLPGHRIILSASGMCEGGRILHHLRNSVENDSTTILIVGYQAPGTLGRRLLEGAKKVKIFGLKHEVRATVRMMDNFSSHADREDLLWFIKKLSPRPLQIFLIHGDEESRQGLLLSLKTEGYDRVTAPKPEEEYKLD
ncbi:MAG: MBL fold metallo-hydrolase [Elusimicrobia bacterium]|nr:MBL fold metallo-hydrolase [Candidatus Obscuribacterium magneticum]